MAFKQFANGELLTAQKVNDYLMRQAVIVCASATEQNAITSPNEGMLIYRTDLDKFRYYSGAAWVDVFAAPALTTAFTPAFTNLTVGNGTLACEYERNGKTVHVKGQLTFGTTTNPTGNPFYMTTPTPMAARHSTILNLPVGWGRLVDVSVPTPWECRVATRGNNSTVKFSALQITTGALNGVDMGSTFISYGTGDTLAWDYSYLEA